MRVRVPLPAHTQNLRTVPGTNHRFWPANLLASSATKTLLQALDLARKCACRATCDGRCSHLLGLGFANPASIIQPQQVGHLVAAGPAVSSRRCLPEGIAQRSCTRAGRENGGRGRNRTAVDGFAIRCLTTWLRDHRAASYASSGRAQEAIVCSFRECCGHTVLSRYAVSPSSAEGRIQP